MRHFKLESLASKLNWRFAGISSVFALFLCTSLLAQVPTEYYKQNCVSCHTIGGGRLTGPDLKDLSKRQDREWLVNWLMDPEGILKSGDPYAVKMQKESRGAVMTRSPGMTKSLAIALLDLIDEESKLEKSQFAGSQISDRPLLQEDIDEGLALFMGSTKLKNGGPSCVSCHVVNSLDGLSGGRLGLNLTRAYARLEGRKGLSAWLISPPSKMMNPIYKKYPIDEEEILPLVAFLKNETEKDAPENTSAMINFLLFGIGGAVLLLVLFDLIWNKRFRAVREPMVKGN
ncbi:MAG: cytochrome c [Calditrichaeota bacterium]|nr:MAG: cytochrome c [Calditrichota bacterium]